MAEYNMTYNELENEIDSYIRATPNNQKLLEYRAEIMAAITGDYSQHDPISVDETISLWQNQLDRSTELRIGKKYIAVRSSLFEFLPKLCASGMLDALIVLKETGSMAGFTISVGTSIAIAIWELINSVKTLDDWDFCIYMQAVTHFNENHGFTKDDLLGWLPHGQPPTCNMHNSIWQCEYFHDHVCTMVIDDHVDDALKSLINKKILKVEGVPPQFTYKFRL